MNLVLRILLFGLLLSWVAMPNVEAVGMIVSRGDVAPTLIGPVGEIETATPKLQWKMEWRAESNPQPSPSPSRMEFTVIIYHDDKPVWESRPINGVSGQSLYELQVPSGVLAPGATFAWQVVAQSYIGNLPGHKGESPMKLFDVRGGCAVRIESIVVPKVNNANVLSGVEVNAYSLQNPKLLLGQTVTNATGEGRMTFAICPIKTTDKAFLGAVRWKASKAGYLFEVVNGVKTSAEEWIRIVMRPGA